MNQRMKSTCLALLLTTLPAAAATVTWDADGSNDLWTTPENWSDNLAPVAGNDYVVSGAGVIVRPPDATSNTFAGDSLTISNGAVLNLYRTNGGSYFNVNHSIPNLTVSNAEIRPQIEGYLLRQTYREGTLVHSGETLFEIDPREFQAAYDQAKGNVSQYEATLANAKTTVARYTPLARVPLHP